MFLPLSLGIIRFSAPPLICSAPGAELNSAEGGRIEFCRGGQNRILPGGAESNSAGGAEKKTGGAEKKTGGAEKFFAPFGRKSAPPDFFFCPP